MAFLDDCMQIELILFCSLELHSTRVPQNKDPSQANVTPHQVLEGQHLTIYSQLYPQRRLACWQHIHQPLESTHQNAKS